MIKASSKHCAPTCATDGSDDDEITCFKSQNPCREGREMLRKQIEFMNAPEDNPFIPDDDDRLAACPEMLRVEENEEEDEDIDVV